MALTNQKINEVIAEIAGEGAVKIIEFLKGKKNISEFTIAEKLGFDMQTTRHILYILHSNNVCSYIRKKDRQKGWYISYWTFDRKHVKDLILKLKKQRIERLQERLIKEEGSKGNFFICSKACARLDFDTATDFEFKCPECGTLLNQQDNTKTIDNIKDQIKILEKFSV